jgi:hypothetical protein
VSAFAGLCGDSRNAPMHFFRVVRSTGTPLRSPFREDYIEALNAVGNGGWSGAKIYDALRRVHAHKTFILSRGDAPQRRPWETSNSWHRLERGGDAVSAVTFPPLTRAGLCQGPVAFYVPLLEYPSLFCSVAPKYPNSASCRFKTPDLCSLALSCHCTSNDPPQPS